MENAAFLLTPVLECGMMHTEAGTYTVCIVQPMHSSTGYGLTTSNPCMGVIKRVADDEVLQLFFFWTSTLIPLPVRRARPRQGRCRSSGTPQQIGRAAQTPSAPKAHGGRRLEEPGSRALCGWRRRQGGALGRTERRRREGAARPAGSVAAGGGPSVSLDHFPALGKMNHGSAAAGPRPHYRFALSFHIGT